MTKTNKNSENLKRGSSLSRNESNTSSEIINNYYEKYFSELCATGINGQGSKWF